MPNVNSMFRFIQATKKAAKEWTKKSKQHHGFVKD
jgi:hypothetical protein